VAGTGVNVTGGFTQTAGGTLSAPLLNSGNAVCNPCTLAVNGAAALAGALNVRLAPGYAPNAGTVIPVVTAASRAGTFGAVTGDRS